MEKQKSEFVKGLIDFIAGSLGGTAQVYVSQPLDTVKVKLQAFPGSYNGLIDCFVKTYKQDGIARGLYAGSLPAVAANVAENSVLFAAYGFCQTAVVKLTGAERVQDLSILGNAFAGFLASFFSTFALCPTELIKCKLQALREVSKVGPTPSVVVTPWSLTKQIYKTGGIRALFSGLVPTMVREMPGYFFFFGAYEGMREFFRKEGQSKDDIGALRTMFSGATGGVALWVAIFPADVIKSRIQINNLQKGMFAVGADIVRSRGFLGLYSGLLPSVLRTIPATASLFLVYENTKKILMSI